MSQEQIHRVEVNGIHLAARSWTRPELARRTPIVMVHGLGVASRICRPAAERLAERHPVHAVDLAGFGLSDKPPDVLGIRELADSLAGWMRATGVGSAVVVGVSLGAQVAAELASRHGDLCAAVVLASPIVEPGRRSWPQQLLRLPIEQHTQSLHLRAIMLADHRACGTRRVIATFSHALEYPIEDTVLDIDCPVLVCRGTRDPLVSQAWAEQLTDRTRAGHLAVIPGGVHAMTYENPIEFSRVVEYFFEGLDRGREFEQDGHLAHAPSPAPPAPGVIAQAAPTTVVP